MLKKDWRSAFTLVGKRWYNWFLENKKENLTNN